MTGAANLEDSVVAMPEQQIYGLMTVDGSGVITGKQILYTTRQQT